MEAARSPGWQVGSTFPAAFQDDMRCCAGLCVISGELLMSYGSCGVNNLSASVSHLGVSNGSVTAVSKHPEGGHPASEAGSEEARQALCRRHAAPPPPASRSSHTLSFPLVLTRCPSLFPALCLLLFLPCPKGIVLSLACWKRCQRMFLCAACQVPGEKAWKCSAGGAVGARESHCFSLLACCIF